MRNFETTFIVDPVLSDGEIKKTAKKYFDLLKAEGVEIQYNNEMGLRQLAYPIKRRNSGVYYNLELQAENGNFIDKLELAFRRDERILRFLTIRLDKYAVQYYQDKRDGKIGHYKAKVAAERKAKAEEEAKNKKDRRRGGGKKRPAPKKTVSTNEKKEA